MKRQSDSRIRREVVGQMLDYAANWVTYWSVETLQSGLQATCAEAGHSLDAVLTELVGLNGSIDDFWNRVRSNLQRKRIRLLFVADEIPLELRRIVEFLNEQMDRVEVLAIELRLFESQGLRAIVPTVYGQTQEAAAKRGGVGPGWDEETLFEKLRKTVGEGKELQVAQRIYG